MMQYRITLSVINVIYHSPNSLQNEIDEEKRKASKQTNKQTNKNPRNRNISESEKSLAKNIINFILKKRILGAYYIYCKVAGHIQNI
jgi:uncharacterized protein (DUF2344 family)